jgi:NADH dehydrogenase (ubiquinone) 1 alpha subcomplex subunit 9
VIVCTGERMEDTVTRVYRSFGLRTTDYDPVHACQLGNEFYAYANFESDAWGWRTR